MIFFSLRSARTFTAAVSILVFSALLAALSISSSLFLSGVAAAGKEKVVELRCPRCPICTKSGTPFLKKMRYCFLSSFPLPAVVSSEFPFATREAARRHVMEDVEELLRTRLVGQPHLTDAILDALRRKLAFPHEPLVLHFAGDNGVGKTYTARLLSLATSLRCAPARPQCDAGDNMLVISGTGFDGMSIADARERIVRRITAHQRKYPHGIVLLDDLTAMHPNLVTALAPLFGRAERFAEQTEDTPPLANLIVVLTTDLGQQGRTYGKTLAQIEQLVRDEFAALYGTLVPAFTRTMLFVSFSRRDAERLVRDAVAALSCAVYFREGAVAASTIDDMAVAFLVERHREVWEGRENGHALRRAVDDVLVALLLRHFERRGHDRRVWARFRLDEDAVKIVLSTGEDCAGAATLRAGCDDVEGGEGARLFLGDL